MHNRGKNKKPTKKEMALCHEYMIDGNASKAAERAGYAKKTAHIIGSSTLKKPRVAAYLQNLMDERNAKTGITAERVLQEIDRLAFLDMGELAKHPITKLGDIANLPEDLRRAIVGYKYDRAGNFVPIFADKARAIEMRAKHMKLFSDELKHSGEITHTVKLDEADKAAVQAMIQSKLGL